MNNAHQRPAAPATPSDTVETTTETTGAAVDTFESLVQSAQFAPDWAAALAPISAQIDALAAAVHAERAAGVDVLPAAKNVWAAFRRPMSAVRVLIVGQDPYPTPGHAMGLSFSADTTVRPLPRSIANIYRELHSDLGIPPATHPDLSHWADQGVLLLNRVLTVRAGDAGSHRGLGWEAVTDFAVRALASRAEPLVAVLWGNDARALSALLDGVPTVQSVHPSPLSASRGFFGSEPFSAVNRLLREQGATPIDWQLPEHHDSSMLW